MANGLKKQKQKWKALAKHKSSLVLYLITILAAAITVFVLGYLIVYILANGIPHLKPSLFAFTYTSDNVSMMPALINTVLMTLATLIVAVLMPATSPSDCSRIVASKPLRSQYRRYWRRIIEAQSCASVPPAPA